jgi:hypothetical protein
VLFSFRFDRNLNVSTDLRKQIPNMELGKNPCGVGRPVDRRTERICRFTAAALPTSVKTVKFGDKTKDPNCRYGQSAVSIQQVTTTRLVYV